MQYHPTFTVKRTEHTTCYDSVGRFQLVIYKNALRHDPKAGMLVTFIDPAHAVAVWVSRTEAASALRTIHRAVKQDALK